MSDILVIRELPEALTIREDTPQVLIVQEDHVVIDSSDGSVLTERVERTLIVEVGHQGPPGPQGNQGLAGESDVTELNAAENLTAYRVVQMSGLGTAQLADRTVLAHIGRVIGITEEAASMGAPVRIRREGFMTVIGWTWTPNQPIFLGANGMLTQTQPTSGVIQVVAVATGTASIFVHIREPLVLPGGAGRGLLTNVNGTLTEEKAVTESAGSADANKIPALGADGKLSETMLPPAGGLVRKSISTGQTLLVPPDYQYIVHQAFSVNGTVAIEGELVVL